MSQSFGDTEVAEQPPRTSVSAAPAAARYVKTKDIQNAIRGREGDVLDALGLDWRSKQHIRCPYPDHGGENDWRWDERKQRAFCTCNKGDSVFDVVMKCEGVDFEGAKLTIAEMIGETSLIIERNGDATRIASDARSLLNPPATNRDDTLVRTYLAFRLGVEADSVLMPVTPVAGIRSVAYFDPPKNSRVKAEWKPVGHYPCAVFGMTGVSGRIHAHRIYLAAGGAGKADLGKTKEGHSRDPKKSAKLPEGQTILGLGVLWGNPGKAKTMLVTEGIETAAAVAYSLRDSITEGKVAVFAAISATGVEAVEPWPPCDQIIIAADRDEAPKNGRPPSRRGEIAARKLGMRLHGQIDVRIALPGSPGSAMDWLDVMEVDGVDAVASGLREAIKFEPTREEIEAQNTERERLSHVEAAARMYPLPELDRTALTYGHTGSGKLRVFKVMADDKGNFTSIPISSPFGVLARLRQIDKGDTYGLRLIVEGMNGTPVEMDVDRTTAFVKGGDELRAIMASAGLRTEDDGMITVIGAIRGADPKNEIAVVTAPGWHHIGDSLEPVFMTPAGDCLAAIDAGTVELSHSVRMAATVAQGGTLDGWKKATTLAAMMPGCEHWTIGLLAGFAGVLVDLTQIDTCGIDFTGMSSAGKSTAQRLAASAWSVPDSTRPGSLFQHARSTDNALEATASRSSGTVLVLDELAHMRGRDVAKVIYMIAGGAGKARMRADASIRSSYTWRTFAILSGESSLEEKIRGDGEEWMAGMAVRIIDIDVTSVNRDVSPSDFRDISAVRQHFGHAGPAFADHIIKTGLHRRAGELRDRIMRESEVIAGDRSDAAIRRAAIPLAVLLVAGQVGQDAGLVDSKVRVKEAINWAWTRFLASSNAEALAPDDHATNALRTWLVARWNLSIWNLNGDGSSRPLREAEAWYDSDAIYIPKDRLRDAAGGKMKEQAVAEMLDRTGGLHRRKDPRHRYVTYVPGLGSINAYALSREKFGMGSTRPEGDQPLSLVAGGSFAASYNRDSDDVLPFS